MGLRECYGLHSRPIFVKIIGLLVTNLFRHEAILSKDREIADAISAKSREMTIDGLTTPLYLY